jgi:hypothetical protein
MVALTNKGVREMSGHPFEGRKLFTPEQANAALPLVRAIVKDLSELSREVIERRERLGMLLDGRQHGPRDLYAEELTQIEQELEKDTERLQEYVDELRQIGVDPKNGPDGLVDFPAMMDGRPVYLCWKLGEPEVLHWHDLEAGFRGRQLLTADSIPAGGVSAGGVSAGGVSASGGITLSGADSGPHPAE